MQTYKYPVPLDIPGRIKPGSSPRGNGRAFLWPNIVPGSPDCETTQKQSWFRRSFRSKKFSSSPKSENAYFEDLDGFEVAGSPKSPGICTPNKLNDDQDFAHDLLGRSPIDSFDTKFKWFNRLAKLKVYDTLPPLRRNTFRRSRRGSRSTENLPSDLQRIEEIAEKRKSTAFRTNTVRQSRRGSRSTENLPSEVLRIEETKRKTIAIPSSGQLNYRQSRRGSRSIENLPSDIQRLEDINHKRKWFNRFPSISSRSSSKASLKQSHSSENINDQHIIKSESLEIETSNNKQLLPPSKWFVRLGSQVRRRLRKSFRISVMLYFLK